jgi:hypothetical protein
MATTGNSFSDWLIYKNLFRWEDPNLKWKEDFPDAKLLTSDSVKI